MIKRLASLKWLFVVLTLACSINFVSAKQSSHDSESSADVEKSAIPFELRGSLTQGSLLRGKVAPGSQIKLNSKDIEVSEAGDFVFGFGRDAKLDHELSYKQANDAQFKTYAIKLSERQYDIQRIEGVAKKYVSPPAEVTKRIKNDNWLVAKARKTHSKQTAFQSEFIMPSKGRISGVFGSQRVFNGQPRRPHFGLDIAAPVGTAVLAPADGVITLAHDDMYYSGGTLIMDHGMGVSSTFIHLSKIHVQEGQAVKQGDLIADIGATGRVTGPHLDWRINWFKERLDPALLVDLP
jgi:murein DD-endopeptidase MepM/ murein hydrolase activator NlpD